MSFLNTLPEDVSIMILSEWLPFDDLKYLDTVCCTTIYRPILLRVFSNLPGVSFETKPSQLPQVYRWIQSRCISLKVLNLSDYCFQAGSSRFLFSRLKLDKVEEILVNTSYFCNGDELMKVINACTAVMTITSDNGGSLTDSHLLMLNPNILSNLNGIECHDNTEMGMLVVLQYCRNLKAFVYDNKRSSCCEVSLLTEIIKLNPSLKNIQLTISLLSVNTLLKAISTYCKSVENILIDVFSDTSDSVDFCLRCALSVIKTNPQLMLLCVNCDTANISYVYSKKSSILKMDSLVLKNYDDVSGDLSESLSQTDACSDIIMEDMPVTLTNCMMLQVVSKSYTCLNYLAVVNCFLVSSATLRMILLSCKVLKVLHLSTDKMTSEEIVSVFEPNQVGNGCSVHSTMESLNLYNTLQCCQITHLTIINIIEVCPSLCYVHLCYLSDKNKHALSNYLSSRDKEGKKRVVVVVVGSVALDC